MKVVVWFRRVFFVVGAWTFANIATLLMRRQFVRRGVVYSSGGSFLEHVVSSYHQSLWALLAGLLCGFGIVTRKPVLIGTVLAGLALLGNAVTVALRPGYVEAVPHARALVMLAALVFVAAYACGFGLQQLATRKGADDAP